MNPVRRIQQASLVASMFILSLTMWAGSPAFWLWLAGRNGRVSGTSGSSLLMIVVGIPVTMVLIGKLLTRLDHRYTDGFGISVAGARNPARWLRSMRGGDVEEQPTMLDKVMVVSISLAMTGVAIFFIFFSAGGAYTGR